MSSKAVDFTNPPIPPLSRGKRKEWIGSIYMPIKMMPFSIGRFLGAD